MKKEDLILLVQEIVKKVTNLKDKHTDQKNVPVHYVAIFSQNQEEYDSLLKTAQQMGSLLKETPTGPLFQVEPIDTISGPLRIVKIRIPDPTRPEKGDADFAAKDYQKLKDVCLSKPGFELIERETFEMIELMDKSFDVRIYFSNPPVEKQYRLA
ncbi:MAG: hypothetical protein M1355_00730 [Patescibacteria group bacterium]|nr:hypothetical protein [Patescibacteria group bacterium]MCL5093651.1 hypothetical protein [Patescibacteria group bacterium]